ncbi:magnesium transporter [Agathobaculum sp.]|uniref:magnesium transporter n=1 Tax=Agathobaculum sp. TaxID=2048138 RepID=UPI003AB7DA92
MKKEVLKEPIFAEKILRIIRSSPSMEEMREQLRDYHDNDIAQSLKYLNRAERNLLYSALDAEWLAEIISYIDDPVEYVDEIGIDKLSAIINEMDADDAVDLWENIDESVKVKLRPMIDDQTKAAILLINSYDDDEVGSLITTNYICIHQSLTIRQAMHELVRQAGENDNIATIYVVDGRNRFCGAIDLKDLIVARENVPLDSLISYAYPYLLDHEKISDSIEKIKDYAEDSLPVLNRDKKIIGIITAQDVVEAVDDELGEDYAKLAGLSAEEDLNETIAESIKKRLPWLIILLFLGMGVSTVVGAFEGVVAVLPVVICFQSLILDMAGNVGTQSLAVTIRVLMDENLSAKDKLHLAAKEMKVGSCNGALLGVMALVFLGVYIVLFKGYSVANAFLISGCVGLSLLAAIVISSLVGTLVPMLFHKVKIDPAVASGPLITTINDLVAVVTYYGLAWVFLIDLFHLV